MQDNRAVLSRVLGRTDVMAIGFGTIIGWSWVMMSASWITGAGFLGAIIAFIIGGLLVLLIGFTYGELTAALPLSGGEYVFAHRAFGKRAAFITGWIMVIAYLGVAAWEGIALATALDYIFPIPKAIPLWEISGYQVHLSWAVIGVAGILLVMIMNLFGAKSAVLFQVLATAAIVVVVMVIFFGGISLGDTENIGDMFTDAKGFFYVLFMVPAMLIGFDVIPQSAEEMNIPRAEVGRMITVCIALGILWYLVLIIGIGLAAPVEIRSSGVAPTADVAGALFGGDAFAKVVIIGGILGIMTTWNGFFMGATRLIYAMGRSGALPKIFARLSRRHRVPWVAICFVGFFCMSAPFLGKNALLWLVDISSLCALIAYSLVAVAAVVIRRREPDLERPFIMGKSLLLPVAVAVLATGYCLADIIYIMSFPVAMPELIILSIWLITGLCLYFLSRGGADIEE